MRAEEKYLLDPGTEQSVWSKFPGSPTQQVLHNEIAELIIEGQQAYDKCDSPEEFRGFQSAVNAFRRLSAKLHKADNIGRANRTRAKRVD